MRRFGRLGIVVFVSGLLALVGCDTEKLAADSTAELFGRAAPGVEQHWDYDLVGKSFPASIIQLEGLLRVVPDNETIGMSLVAAYIGYGTGWIEDRVEVADLEDEWEEADALRRRALVMYTRAWDLSQHFLRNRDPGFDAALAGEWDIFHNALDHLILPASILGTFALAYIARMTRSFMLDQLSQEYILTARVKGLPEWQVIWGHAFRNVLVQLITIIGLTYASLLEGSVLTETIFSWPGIGLYITNSLFNNDMNAVLGGTIVVGVCFVGINMLSDLLYKLVDPRVR